MAEKVNGKTKKKVRTIRIDADKCNGCRTCEIVCSGFHSNPPFSSINPAASRIHILTHRLKDIWLPVFAGEYTPPSAGAGTITSLTARTTGSAPSAGRPARPGTCSRNRTQACP